MDSLTEHVARSRESALRERGIPEPSYAISTLAWAKGYTLSILIRHTCLGRDRPELRHDRCDPNSRRR